MMVCPINDTTRCLTLRIKSQATLKAQDVHVRGWRVELLVKLFVHSGPAHHHVNP